MPEDRSGGGKRVFYLDVARALSIFAVSMNHAVNRTYENYSNQIGEFLLFDRHSTVIKAVVTVFSWIGVPLFLMISGILLMNKRMENGSDLKRFYRHNLLSLFITTEIWYGIMYWFILFFDPSNRVLEERGAIGAVVGMVETMLFQNQVTMGSMWYMPMILCLYTTVPALIVVKEKLGLKAMGIPLLVIFLNAMVLPALNVFLGFCDIPAYTSGNEFFVGQLRYYLYFIVGYWIGQGGLSKLKNWLVGVLALGVFAGCCAYQYYAYSQPRDYLLSYTFPGILLLAALIMEFLRRNADCLQFARVPISYIAKISFGIYFVHILIMSALDWGQVFSGFRHIWKMMSLEAVSFLGSVAIIWVLSKVKVFRRYLFMIKNESSRS